MTNLDNDPRSDYAHDQVDIAHHMPFLEDLASRAAVIVEVGCGHGNGSTRAFARGLERSTREGKMFISVDADPVRPQVRPTLPYWRVIHGKSEKVSTAGAVRLALGPQQTVDILFIDTDHTYEQLRQELGIWSLLVAHTSTLWVFHDTYMFGEYNPMTDAIKEYCAAFPQWEFIDHSRESHGLGLMKRRNT